MCEAVERFLVTAKDQPEWHFHERRKFLNNHDARQNLMKELSKANSKLRKVVKICKSTSSSTGMLATFETPTKQPEGKQRDGSSRTEKVAAMPPQLASTDIRRLSLTLFATVRKFWSCQCRGFAWGFASRSKTAFLHPSLASSENSMVLI